MRGRYLEVTFRKGRAIAAYLYLPRRGAERAARVSKATPGLLIDYNANGKAIGIEITAPGKLSLAALNRVLTRLCSPCRHPSARIWWRRSETDPPAALKLTHPHSGGGCRTTPS